MKIKSGVIGLGAMGAGIAMNLHRAGHLHRVWNRTIDRSQSMARELGVTVASSVRDLAMQCDLILISVSRDADVIEVVTAISAAARPGTIVVDTSTVSTGTAIQAEKTLSARSIEFLDCPVSGGVEGARNGTLSMMVGGNEDTLEKVHTELSSVAANIVYIGQTGSGQACKAVNQVMCAGINQAVTEALAFGADLGLDMTRVIDVVTKGAAGNWFLAHRGRTMLEGAFPAGFKVALHLKDLIICMKMADQNPAMQLKLVKQTIGDYEKLISLGYGEEDISSLYRLKRH